MAIGAKDLPPFCYTKPDLKGGGFTIPFAIGLMPILPIIGIIPGVIIYLSIKNGPQNHKDSKAHFLVQFF